MNQQREWPATQAARAVRPDQALPGQGPDRGTLARGGTWLRDGTPIRVPLRARLALVQPHMLKAQAGRPARS